MVRTLTLLYTLDYKESPSWDLTWFYVYLRTYFIKYIIVTIRLIAPSNNTQPLVLLDIGSRKPEDLTNLHKKMIVRIAK